MESKTIFSFIFMFTFFLVSYAGIESAKRLYQEIGSKADESKLWRPVLEDESSIVVYLGVTFVQIMNVDEKMKIISTSVQLRQIWKNKYLSWKPNDYDGIKSIYLPHDSIWLPDVVLYNNADGKYETRFHNKPILYYNGLIDWKSPAIFQSSCEIDVKYFPYDEQICYLNFGSWTYNKDQVKLRHVKQLEVYLEQSQLKPGSEQMKIAANYSKQKRFQNGAFLTNYYRSGEWDLMETPAILSEDNNMHHDCIQFGMKIRRKIMFYNINLIFPMVGMSILASLSFYLPVKSGEKIDLSTQILFGITVFFILLSETVPPSSLVTPIINQYLIITFLLISISVWSTVFVLNLHFRSHLTDSSFPQFLKKRLLKYLQNILFLEVPPKCDYLQKLRNDILSSQNKIKALNNSLSNSSCSKYRKEKHIKCFKVFKKNGQRKSGQSEDENESSESFENMEHRNLINRQIKEASLIISEISEDLIKEININNIQNEYMDAAVVLDRLILFVFCFFSLITAMVTYLQSPSLYDSALPMNESLYNDSNLNRLLLQQL